jgi:hypothetical protein
MSRPSVTEGGPQYANPAELTPGDALVGALAIQRFRNDLLGTNTSLAATFKQLIKKQIPAEKHAGTWIGSRIGIRRFYGRNLGLAA